MQQKILFILTNKHSVPHGVHSRVLLRCLDRLCFVSFPNIRHIIRKRIVRIRFTRCWRLAFLSSQ